MASNKQPKPSKKPGKKNRLDLTVGDIVALQSPFRAMTGTMAEVTHILNKGQVVVRGMGAEYTDYDNRLWVALAYTPTGTTPDGDPWSDQHLWVRKILYTKRDLPPKVKKRKIIVAPTVVEGLDGLRAALASDEKHAAVEFTPGTTQPEQDAA